MIDQQFILRGRSSTQTIPQVQLGQYFLDRIQHYGDKVAQEFPQTGKVVTFADIIDRGVSVAIELRAHGVHSGDVVVILCDSCPEFTYVLMGCLLVGASLAPLNPTLDNGDLKLMLRILEPHIIFAVPDSRDPLLELVDCNVEIVTLAEDSTGWLSFLLHSNNNHGDFTAENSFNVEDHTAIIMSSSGTTGLPKGVQITHANIHAVILALRRHEEPVASNEVTLTVSPMFWVSGILSIILALDVGNRIIVLLNFEAELVLSAIEKHKVNVLSLGPSQIVAIAKCPTAEQYDTSSLRFLGYGGAPLSRAMQKLVEKKLNLKVISLYGMTEIMFAIIPGTKILDKPTSSGALTCNTWAKVIDLETGKPLGPYQEGELCFKGPSMMLGYYKNPQATANTIDSEGWLHTGDVGHYDEDHYFYIYDRIKELIKYKGNVIAPIELEDVLLSHPHVKEATVISVHHDLDQEHPMACVVRQPGTTVTEGELVNLVKEKLCYNKWLHGGVKFVDSIPRTASGKVKRRELRAIFSPVIS